MWQRPNVLASFEAQPIILVFNDDAKRSFGQALNTHKSAFDAALSVWHDTANALWASKHLLNDPAVLVAKTAYNEAENLKLLDKQELAAKCLEYADETDPTGRFRMVDHKDRLAYLRLYAELQGFVGKVDITQNTFNQTNNVMKIKLVKPEVKEEKIINSTPIQQEEHLPVKLKLVSGSSR